MISFMLSKESYRMATLLRNIFKFKPTTRPICLNVNGIENHIVNLHL